MPNERRRWRRGSAPEPAPAPAPAPRRPTPPGDPKRGPLPEVPVEETHFGPFVDARVARARRSVQQWQDPDWVLVREHLDVLHYLNQANYVFAHPQADPVRHFMLHGRDAERDPEPDFSTAAYVARYPERDGDGPAPYLAWLREGREAGEIADPAPGVERAEQVYGRPAGEVVEDLVALRADLTERFRSGMLGEMLAKAAEIEPQVAEAWTATTSPRIQPLVNEAVTRQMATIEDCQRQAGWRRARLLLVIGDPRWGGGRRMEGHIAHALAGEDGAGLDPDDIVVIYTEKGGEAPPGRFPAGVREVDFASAIAIDPEEELDPDVAERALVELIRSFHADAVVNVNSGTFYRALSTYGAALRASERIFILFFCNEQMNRGNWRGLPLTQFYRQIDVVEGVLADSRYLVDWFDERHLLDDETRARLHVLAAPVDPTLEPAARPERPADHRPTVYWAGRWDRQKRVDLAFDIARLLPDVRFVMYGGAVLDGDGLLLVQPDNVEAPGTYGHITELDLAEADLWLYTSGWDGVPSMLLEVGMTGVPIVASDVGGVDEVLDPADARLLGPEATAEDYAAAIREVLADPASANAQAAALRERLLAERSRPGFASFVADLLLPDTAEKGADR